jgi:hypothetical protein
MKRIIESVTGTRVAGISFTSIEVEALKMMTDSILFKTGTYVTIKDGIVERSGKHLSQEAAETVVASAFELARIIRNGLGAEEDRMLAAIHKMVEGKIEETT